jgi:peptidoglycan/LPS O-acetylase OafA/YrhL
MSEKASTYIPTLDGWRAIAIFAVMASHSQQLFQPHGVFPNQSAERFLSYLRLGVDLFFAISGFLITRLLMRESARTGAFSLRAFYVRRFFRIVPLIAFYLFFLWLASFRIPGLVAPWEFFATLLFARNYLMHWTGDATNQFWSLSLEEHFYLFWPPVLALLGSRKALRAAIVGAVVIAVWRAVDNRYHIFGHIFPEDAGVLYRSDTRCDALLVGAIPALAWDKTQTLISRVRSFPLTAATFVALVAAIVARAPALPTLMTVLFPLLVMSTVCRPSSVFSSWLEARPMRWVGRLSYSLYVWQTLFLQVRQTSFSRRAVGSSPMWVLGAYFLDLALIFTCALVTNRLIEGPLRRRGQQLASQWTTQASTVRNNAI